VIRHEKNEKTHPKEHCRRKGSSKKRRGKTSEEDRSRQKLTIEHATNNNDINDKNNQEQLSSSRQRANDKENAQENTPHGVIVPPWVSWEPSAFAANRPYNPPNSISSDAPASVASTAANAFQHKTHHHQSLQNHKTGPSVVVRPIVVKATAGTASASTTAAQHVVAVRPAAAV